MGVLGPRLNLRVLHSGRPHYFYNRSVFHTRDRRHPHYAPYLGALTYNGGTVETVPKTYLIFWGWSGSLDLTADPYGVAPYMVKFFQAMPASSWLNTVTQYYQNIGGQEYVTNPAGQFGGAAYDSATVPSTYTDADVQNEAIKYANTSLGYDVNANYIVITPHRHTIVGFDSAPDYFCAYHSAVYTTHGWLSYTVFPYLPDSGHSGYDCGAGSANPTSSKAGILDGISVVGGHEEAEAMTDAVPNNGWLDATGYEIADKCAWYNIQNTSFGGSTVGTNMFPTQPLWSNASGPKPNPTATPEGACVQSYSASPTPSPSPTPGNVVTNGGFETGHLSPWTTCHSAGRMPLAFIVSRHAHGGKYDAYSGTIANHKEPAGITSVCQRVNVPAHARVIVWVRGISDDKRAGVYQFGRLVNISGTVAKTFFKFNRNDTKWVREEIDLSAYANGQYYLAFGIAGKKNAHGHYIGLYVDDVSLGP